MRTLRVCDVGLSEDASHAFRSMIKVVQGGTTMTWELSDPDHAQVLFVHCSSDSSVRDACCKAGKPWVCILDGCCRQSDCQRVLRHPFRVMQLIDVLNDTARELQADSSPTPANQPQWAVLDALHQLTSSTPLTGWHVADGASAADGQVWIGPGSALASDAVIRQLRSQQWTLSRLEKASSKPAGDVRLIAWRDMAWWFGMNTPHGLAPWLHDDAVYWLSRWPDFGRLGAHVGDIELAAWASSGAHTPAELVEKSGYPEHKVHRFLAAASLAQLLQESR